MYLFHHIVAPTLIICSYMFKATRWGIALWFIYEQNDFILRFNRVIRQLKECQNLYKYMLLTHTI